MSAEWIDFSFKRQGEGCLVCSAEEAAAWISAGELTADTRITLFGPKGRKVMRAGDHAVLGFAPAAPVAEAVADAGAGAEEAPVPVEMPDAAETAPAPAPAVEAARPSAVEEVKARARNRVKPVTVTVKTPESVPVAAPEEVAAEAGAGDAGVGAAGAGSGEAQVGEPVDWPPPSYPPLPPPPPGPSAAAVVFGILAAVLTAIIIFVWVTDRADAGSVRVVVTSTANVRDQPTAEGSTVLFQYEPGQELQGEWVDGARNPAQKWLQFEVDGETRYVWQGNLRELSEEPAAEAAGAGDAAAAAGDAAAAAAPASEAAAAVPSLTSWVGGYPYQTRDGMSFWAHPAVTAAVRAYVPRSDIRAWILSSGVESEVTQLPDGRVVARACEPHNCGSHEWRVIIADSGEWTQICYYDSAAGRDVNGYYNSTGFVPMSAGEGGCPQV